MTRIYRFLLSLAAVYGLNLGLTPAYAGSITFSNNCQGRNIPIGQSYTCGVLTFSGTGTYQGVSLQPGSSGSLDQFRIDAPSSGACIYGGTSGCTIGTVVFTPKAAGLHYFTVQLVGHGFGMGVQGSGYYAAAWQYSSWTPTLGSGCTSSLEQTRTVICRLGTEVQPDSSCNTNSKPAASQVVSDFSGCTFRWVTSPMGACTGGSGTWHTGSWAPALGCGATLQTRSVTCVIDANSGTAPLAIACQRSDGSPANESNCDPVTRPSSTASCTPVDPVCGEVSANSQTVSLRNGCPTGCVPDAHNGKYCLRMPL
jgi:hypothetical protein